ncbi:MAG: serine/threonine protein kinase [Phycisphaeraceae bacterium]|nr:serine/threonine protein kinase [Phycisphaerales bacterium]MCB9861206.1 serine/threonine protein kinase [Phycisphaeraceae bacterium]
MNETERFRRVAELFETARSMRGHERTSFLEDKCNGDDGLIAEVHRLLGHHESRHGLLEEPITPAAVELLSKPREDGAIPETIGQYDVHRLIGAGGMGAVYLAEQRNPKRMVALKVIRPGVISSDALRRFELEASMLGRLQHAGIAQIYEAGTYNDGVGDRPYFAMEYVDGVPLLKYTELHGLDTRARLELVAKMCDAVQHAHQHGVIHRDLKPGNILVDGSGQPKVLDFGVARSVDEDSHTLATQAGALLGTIGYMSPEQIDGKHDDVDTRTDIHALGVIMYELLSGRMPYDLSDTTMTGALQRVRENVPTMLGKVNPALRGDIETICAKAIEKDKSRRYQSASDLRDDIHRFLQNEPITARPASTMYQLQKLAQRNKALFVAAGVALFALVGTLVAVSIAAYEISRQRDEAVAAMNDANGATRFLSDVLMSLDPRQRGKPEVALTDFLDDVTERLDAGQLEDQPRVEAVVRETVGTAYRELGLLDVSQTHLERSLELYETVAKGTPAQRATVLCSLGGMWARKGNLERAEKLLAESISLFETVHGEDRYGAAGAMHSLASIRLEQRELDEAESLLHQAIELRRDEPQLHPEFLARTLTSLAAVMRRSGRSEEAKGAYEEALAIQRSLHREPRLDIAQTMNNLAILYMYEEDVDAAQPLLEEVLAIRQAFLPENHPDIARVYNSLGGIYSIRGNAEKAEEMYLKAVAMYVAAYGEEHASLGTPYMNLGVSQRVQGRYTDAVRSLEHAIAIKRASYGEQHIQVAPSLLHLAQTYILANESTLAYECALEAHEIFCREEGESSSQSVVAASVLGYSLALTGEFDKAEELLLMVDTAMNAVENPSARVLRAMARNREWIVDMYERWNNADPIGNHLQDIEKWRVSSP